MSLGAVIEMLGLKIDTVNFANRERSDTNTLFNDIYNIADKFKVDFQHDLILGYD